MRLAAPGFTLVELLVVIALVAVVGTITLANFRTFGEDENLKSAILDIQSQFRVAQTNATTNVKCAAQYGTTWQVEFASTNTVNLKCSASSNPQKTSPLGTNIEIQQVSGTGSNCPTALPFTVGFAPLNGKIDFGDLRCTSLTITLKNNKTESTKSLSIEQGGRIYGQ